MEQTQSPARSDQPQMNPMQQLQNLTELVNNLRSELSSTRTQLAQIQAQYAQTTATVGDGRGKAKANQPSPFNGKQVTKIESWASQMDLYIAEENPQRAFAVALSYLEGDAHSWYITYSSSNPISTWNELKEALIRRFSPLDKTLSARDKLATWRQMKDVGTFNTDFLRIVLDIPDITEAEKMDRYVRGLKPYIWEVLCTKEYQTLENIMTDALKVEAAKKGRRPDPKTPNQGSPKPQTYMGPTPMDLSSTNLVRLTPQERDNCLKKGLCLRCREPGHIARICPKGKGRESAKPHQG